MSSYSQGQLGAGFFTRQLRTASSFLPNISLNVTPKKTIQTPLSPSGPNPSPSLPEVNLKSKTPLYIGAGIVAVILLLVLKKKR